MCKNYRIYLIIPFCIIIPLFACAGKPVDGPAIKFEQEIHQFGEVNEGEKVAYSFKFKNIGNENVKIIDVRPTCGCTAAGEYDKEIPPGASGTIPVELKTNGYEGEITKIIKVTTNVPEKEEIVLTLRGSVHTPVIVKPKVLWLGQVNSTISPLKGFFTVQNNSDTPLKIQKIVTPADQVTTKITPIKKNQEYQIDITINPPFGEGRVTKAVTIETNNPLKKTITVHYSYTVKAGVSVYPQVIYVEPGTAEQEYERIVTVENTLPEPVKIINPQVSGGAINFLVKELDPGKLYQIKLLFPKKFTITGKEMLVFTFQLENSHKTDVYNIAIKPAK
jgi:hypothetical protein